MSAMLLHYPNRKNYERTTGTGYAFGLWKWNLCEVLHSYYLTPMSKSDIPLHLFQFPYSSAATFFSTWFGKRPASKFGMRQGSAQLIFGLARFDLLGSSIEAAVDYRHLAARF
ncbi:MAG TPA: hypothetical protein VJ864_01575 [Candidatus Binatia bacterium]|nr:hypothetical protein [Candidatus Binatia bacterium]